MGDLSFAMIYRKSLKAGEKLEKLVISKLLTNLQIKNLKEVINRNINKNFIKAEKAPFPSIRYIHNLTYSKFY